MELKQAQKIKNKIDSLLLIVPYGIETYYDEDDIKVDKLLIVPYGIETSLWMGSPLLRRGF